MAGASVYGTGEGDDTIVYKSLPHFVHEEAYCVYELFRGSDSLCSCSVPTPYQLRIWSVPIGTEQVWS